MNAGRLVVAVLPVALLATSCRKTDPEPLTAGEARQALEETAISGEAASVTSGAIEIATSFTLGAAVEDAAAQIRAFVAAELPCAEIALTDAMLTVTYGAKPGNCTYRGHTYSGSHSIQVSRNDEDDVLVEHTWDALSNGRVSVSGTADVTWSLSEKSRRIAHELTWTRLSDGRTATGSGDRTQTALEGGLKEGIRIDGSRAWEGNAGKWDLTIDAVEMRWGDPVPQAGKYTLATPKDQLIELGFERVDEDTIRVTLENEKRSFLFNVSSEGAVSER